MIDRDALSQLIATYAKHGWVLRRVLLTAPIADGDLFRDAVVASSDIDAAWFSRPPSSGPVAWEIRHLGDSPFALVEFLDETDDGFEDARQNVEERLRSALAAKIQA